MPVSEPRKDDAQESSRDIEREKEKDKDKDKERPSKSKSASKTKDLSHVPCKFFKVGSCTAGSSCPFSHAVLEPGQQKEVCAWFVKGNCKFGHKCALAHILPGQSMSMDRKNKKAAQAAASAANSNGSAGREGHRAGRAQRGTGSGSHGAGSRNALLSGSTAPTRSLSASRPLPMKATLSPSTPAPPVQNTDFASFGLPDESNKLPSAPAQGKTSSLLSSEEVTSESNPDAISELARPEDITEMGEAGPSPPLATISAPRRSNAQDGKEGVDFGPIGSPPRPVQTAVRIARVNGFSPGTSPKTLDLSTSPFSAPGAQSVFMVQEKEGSDFKTRSGLSASLGALMSWGLESSGATTIRKSTEAMYPINDEVAVEDGELEEFIPSSLTELLTPEERSRRFSRTTSGRPIVATERESFAGQSSTLEGPHHRYSRSVPAPSLLQDLRSIWSEAPETGSNTISVNTGGLGNGTPSSFQSNSGFGARVDDIVAPSNASAAFLPGLHHYINAKSTRSNLTAGMSSLYGHPTGAPASLHTTSVFESALNGSAMSPPRLNSFAGNSTLDSIADPYAVSRHPSARPIHGGNDGQADIDDRRSGFSPSTRALQAHAPGQSLPQGLAAGYSRIHALPPPPAIPSPSTSGAFSPGRANGFSPSGKGLGHTHSGSLDWHSSSPNTGMIPEHPSPQTTANAQSSNSVSVGGLENMFSRLSYSAAASRAPTSGPPGIAPRNVSGRSWHNGQGQGPLSPLSGPVLTGDDDDLFSMDG